MKRRGAPQAGLEQFWRGVLCLEVERGALPAEVAASDAVCEIGKLFRARAAQRRRELGVQGEGAAVGIAALHKQVSLF